MRRLLLFITLACCFSLSSCSDHPDETITFNPNLDYWQMKAKNNGNYFQCGNVDLYSKSSFGWEEEVYCVLWGKEDYSGQVRYYVAIQNDSIYEDDWKMSLIVPSTDERQQYSVFYHGDYLYCWGTLPEYF